MVIDYGHGASTGLGAMQNSPATRRQFVFAGLGAAASARLAAKAVPSTPPPAIETVLGAISPAQLGTTLMHEHVLVDFGGAAVAGQKRYDPDEAFRVALPHLTRLRELGGQTLVECTPAYLGRDVRLLKRLSQASGVQVLTNTGYYGAAGGKGVPAHATRESAEELAARWIRERQEGIEGTEIKPAFIKTGVDKSPLSETDSKLVRAAALTHLATGLVIAAHTTDAAAAREELLVLEQAGVSPSAWIWVHAQSAADTAVVLDVAARGAWISLDGIAEASLSRHLSLLQALRARLKQVLLSQDAGWYHVGEPGGGEFKPFDFLFTRFLPAMKKEGFSDEAIHQLLVENPRQVLLPAVKRR